MTYRFIGGIDGIVCVSIGSIHKLVVDEQLMWEAQFHVVLLHLHLINNNSHRSNKLYRKTNGQNTCELSASHMHKQHTHTQSFHIFYDHNQLLKLTVTE